MPSPTCPYDEWRPPSNLPEDLLPLAHVLRVGEQAIVVHVFKAAEDLLNVSLSFPFDRGLRCLELRELFVGPLWAKQHVTLIHQWPEDPKEENDACRNITYGPRQRMNY